MNREKHSDYLQRKIDYLEKQLFQIQDKHTNFQQLIDRNRESEEKDVETCKKWILDQEQKDVKLQRELETVKAQIESLKQRSYEKSIDDQEGLIQKVEELGGSVEELKQGFINSRNSFITKTREFEGEMKVISEWIIKEEEKDYGMMSTLEIMKMGCQKLREEIDSGKIDQQLVLKSANIELKAIRGDFEESKMVQNSAFQRICELTNRLNETEFLAKQMYQEVGDQQVMIQTLSQENRLLREENTRFQKQLCEAFRALREEVRSNKTDYSKTMLEMKKAKDQYAYEQQQNSPTTSQAPANKFGEFRDPSPSSDSVDSVEISENPSIKIVQEVLASWKLDKGEKKTEPEAKEDIVSTVTISMSPSTEELPIEEAIVGEWKLISPNWQPNLAELFQKLENIKLEITGHKLTTYFKNGFDYVKHQEFQSGYAESFKNYWYIQNDSVISVDFKGRRSETELAERCTITMQNGRLLMMHEASGGLVYSMMYERS